MASTGMFFSVFSSVNLNKLYRGFSLTSKIDANYANNSYAKTFIKTLETSFQNNPSLGSSVYAATLPALDTDNQMGSAYSEWSYYDMNGDGYLSERELKDLQFYLIGQQAGSFYSTCDLNSDTNITETELSNLSTASLINNKTISSGSTGSTDDELRTYVDYLSTYFSTLDSNSNGTITSSEYATARTGLLGSKSESDYTSLSSSKVDYLLSVTDTLINYFSSIDSANINKAGNSRITQAELNAYAEKMKIDFPFLRLGTVENKKNILDATEINELITESGTKGASSALVQIYLPVFTALCDQLMALQGTTGYQFDNYLDIAGFSEQHLMGILYSMMTYLEPLKTLQEALTPWISGSTTTYDATQTALLNALGGYGKGGTAWAGAPTEITDQLDEIRQSTTSSSIETLIEGREAYWTSYCASSASSGSSGSSGNEITITLTSSIATQLKDDWGEINTSWASVTSNLEAIQTFAASPSVANLPTFITAIEGLVETGDYSALSVLIAEMEAYINGTEFSGELTYLSQLETLLSASATACETLKATVISNMHGNGLFDAVFLFTDDFNQNTDGGLLGTFLSNVTLATVTHKTRWTILNDFSLSVAGQVQNDVEESRDKLDKKMKQDHAEMTKSNNKKASSKKKK